MSPLQEKPVIHGRDHSPGGADPIFGVGGEVEWEDVGGPGGVAANPVFVATCWLVERTAINSQGQYEYVPNWGATPGGYYVIHKNTLGVTTFGYSPGYANDAKYGIAIGQGWFHIEYSWHYWKLNTDTTPMENGMLVYTALTMGATIAGAGSLHGRGPHSTQYRSKWQGGTVGGGLGYQAVYYSCSGPTLIAAPHNGFYCNFYSTHSDLLDQVNNAPNLFAMCKIERLGW